MPFCLMASSSGPRLRLKIYLILLPAKIVRDKKVSGRGRVLINSRVVSDLDQCPLCCTFWTKGWTAPEVREVPMRTLDLCVHWWRERSHCDNLRNSLRGLVSSL